jgi:hypothetical protein
MVRKFEHHLRSLRDLLFNILQGKQIGSRETLANA